VVALCCDLRLLTNRLVLDAAIPAVIFFKKCHVHDAFFLEHPFLEGNRLFQRGERDEATASHLELVGGGTVLSAVSVVPPLVVEVRAPMARWDSIDIRVPESGAR